MSTVYRFDGLRVVMYSNDHPPAHVHVMGDGREVIFDLNCPDGPPEVRRVSRRDDLRSAEANRIRSALIGRLAQLCAKWRAIHGDH